MLRTRFQRTINITPWALSGALLGQFIALICLLVGFLYIGRKFIGIYFSLLIGAAFVLFLMWKIKDFFVKKISTNAMQVLGQTVTRQQAPFLWSMVDTVAMTLKTAPPEHIILSMNEGFWVTDFAVFLSNSRTNPGERTLCLSIPFMNYMTQAEFQAIISHELAHLANKDLVSMRMFNQLYHRAYQNNYVLSKLDERHTTFFGSSLVYSGRCYRIASWAHV